MVKEMINDLVSYHHQVLLIGSLSDFDKEIQKELSQYQLDITHNPPDNYHIKDYAAIVVSPLVDQFEMTAIEKQTLFSFCHFLLKCLLTFKLANPLHHHSFDLR